MITNEGERLSRELVQLPLIEVLKQIFEGEPFDATDVWSKSFHHPALEAALDAEVPRPRYKSGYKKGRFNTRAIRMALRHLDGLEVRHHASVDYWTFRVKAAKPAHSNYVFWER
jgi:hypothetical protein